MRKTFIKALSLVMTMTISVSAMIMPISADFEKTDKGISYTDESGKKLTGWQTIDGNRYYFDKDGIAKKGFVKFKSGTMYFGSDGSMKTGWVKISKKTYYFTKKGYMATGKYNIGSKQYTFDKNGVWDNEPGLYVSKYDFRNSNWGDTIEEVKKVEKEDLYGSGSDYVIKNRVKLNDKPYIVGYLFDEKKGTLHGAGYALIDLEDNDEKIDYISEYNSMYKIYEKKYGKPIFNGKTDKTFYNKFNKTYISIPEGVINNNIVIWETESSVVCMAVIELDDYGECLDILYASKEYLESTGTD